MKTFILPARLGAVLCAAWLTGCALAPTSGTPDIQPLLRDASFEPPAQKIDSRSIFALDASMRSFIATEIAPRARREDPRKALLDTLNGKLRLDYDSEMTRTASQAFAAREGNCLSLVIMTAAFARQLGIRVTFQDVYGFDTWSRDAGLDVLSQHVNLILGQPQPKLGVEVSPITPMIVDFVPARQIQDAVTRPVSEQTIIAMYMNNRAAEVMAAGNIDQAYWFARAALEADSTFADAANTLGVIYWKKGQLAASEQALRYTLEREPGNIPALSNMWRVLEAEGRAKEAKAVASRLAEIQQHPPFYFYDLGAQALKAGDYAAAARQFKKSLSQRPYDVQSHFGLALAALHLGDIQRARKELTLAMKNSTTRDQRALYAAKLRHLKSF